MPPFRPRRAAALALTAFLAASAAAAQTPPPEGDAGAYLAARTALGDSDYQAASFWQRRALIGDPANPVLLEGLTLSDMALGDFAGAAEAARQLLAAGSTSPVAHMAVMVEKAGAEDFAGILADLDEGRSVGRLLDDLVRAWAELGNGRMSESVAAFDRLAAAPGLEAFGLFHKALALASVGDFEGADEILSGRAAGPINLNRRGMLAHARILSQLEQNDKALERLDGAFGTTADPGVDVLRAALRAGETLPYDTTTGARDGIAEVFFTMAGALNGEAEDGYTLLYARAAAFLNPRHTEAVLFSAGLLEQQEQYDLATQTYAQVPPDDPTFHVAEIGRAGALQAAGKADAAIEVLQALTRAHSDLPTTHIALGDALRREERFAEALPAYDAALALLPQPEQAHWPLYYSRGIVHERLGDFPRAEADMRQALALQPDQPQVLNYLGYSFVDRGENLEEALDMIQRAVAREPQSGYIIDSLAWALFRLGRYDEALAPMEQASLLEPVDPIVTDHLGDVYWAVGRQREAQFQWRRALSFEPTEKDAARIRRKLEIGLDAVLAEEGAPPLRPAPAPADAD
jgi:tetratricopeptide (TPR) repeat protein